MKIKLTFTEELLGTKPMNLQIFADFLLTKADDEARKEELENAAHREIAGTTGFHRDALGAAFIYDYQIKGFFKDACSAMNRWDEEARGGLEKLKAYKTRIDGCIFVFPRIIPLLIPEGKELALCERPVRGETAQGPRVFLVRSETAPVGTALEFEVQILEKALKPYVQEWLKAGALRGLGQWRNGGKGRFNVEILD